MGAVSEGKQVFASREGLQQTLLTPETINEGVLKLCKGKSTPFYAFQKKTA